jgi:dTDP-glucose 4,6-dehydratase
MTTSVVTGGAGFLGSHLCDYLLAKGERVICVDSLETGSLQNIEHLRGDAFEFVNHDVTFHLEVDGPSTTSITSPPPRRRSTTSASPS